jgi:hypothetical protein
MIVERGASAPLFKGENMIAMLDRHSYIDVDKIDCISGDYRSEKESEWVTTVLIGGFSLEYKGQMGREIMNAYEWKFKTSTYDFITGSSTYKRAIK